MKHIDECNFLAIELIEFLGNDQPRQEQIDLVEYLVAKAVGLSGRNNETRKN